MATNVHEAVIGILSGTETGFSFGLEGRIPEMGYMVSLPGAERIVDINEDLAHSIIQYMGNHLPILRDAKYFLGGWVHEGKLYLDVSENILDVRKAKIAGYQRKQLAIWDVVYSREIVL